MINLLDQDTKLNYYDAIKRYGGSFFQALAEAMVKADATNLRKIQDNWGAEIERTYSKFIPRVTGKWENPSTEEQK